MPSFVVVVIVSTLLVNEATGTTTNNIPSQTAPCRRRGPSAQETAHCLTQADVTPATNEQDVAFFKRCIQNYFRLEPASTLSDRDKKKFKKPQFEEYLQKGTDLTKYTHFKKTALRVERFFKRVGNRNWETTKTTYRNALVDLLSIANARYLYVTYLLYRDSGFTLKACAHDPEDKIIFTQGVCFLPPYGTTSATSDYDVGLVGRRSGSVASKFNTLFEAAHSNMPSEVVFDTNIYGYSLEYSMPSLFAELPFFYLNVMPQLDFGVRYQMLELVGAYFKMFRFWPAYYTEYRLFATAELGAGSSIAIPNRKRYFDAWVSKFLEWDGATPLTYTDPALLRARHNQRYSEILGGLLTPPDDNTERVILDLDNRENVAEFVTQMSEALVYAAEAYHTKGAMRHVVGIIQLNKQQIKDGMTIMDYWVSMIENWADANKAFRHCPVTAQKCLLTLSKYIYRAFQALRRIRDTLYNYPSLINKLKIVFPNQLPVYPHYKRKCDPEILSKKWVLEYRGKGIIIPQGEVRSFLKGFGCTEAYNVALTRGCMDKIQIVVKSFNDLLVKTTKIESTEDTVLYKPSNGQLKERPAYSMRKE